MHQLIINIYLHACVFKIDSFILNSMLYRPIFNMGNCSSNLDVHQVQSTLSLVDTVLSGQLS